MVPWAKLHFISKKVILSFPLSIAAGAQGQPLLWEEVASLLFIARSPAFRAGCGCSSSFCCEMSLVNSQSLWGWGTRGRQHSTWADFWRAEAAAALGLGLHFKHHQHRNVTDTCTHQKKCLRQGQDGKGFHYPCPLLSARWGPHSRPAESRGSHGFPALPPHKWAKAPRSLPYDTELKDWYVPEQYFSLRCARVTDSLRKSFQLYVTEWHPILTFTSSLTSSL